MQCHCRTKRDNLLHRLFGLRQKFCSDDLQASVVGIAADAFHLTPVSDFHAAALTLCDFFRPLTMPQFFLHFSDRCHFLNSSGLYPFGVIIPHFYSAVESWEVRLRIKPALTCILSARFLWELFRLDPEKLFCLKSLYLRRFPHGGEG